MPGRESPKHLNLKRFALAWAQTQGFRIAAAEVTVPNFGGCRLDAAGYRPEHSVQAAVKGRKAEQLPRLGATVIFECKQHRADFLRDSRCEELIAARLQKLHERRQLYEESMKPHFPTLRTGDTLFPELDSYRFEAAGYEPYDKLLAEIRSLSRRLHSQTKFAKLIRWKAANLHYVVAEADVVKSHELPAGWGLLIRKENALELREKAVWQEAPDHLRWALLLRIATSGTRAVNRHLDIEFTSDRGKAE